MEQLKEREPAGGPRQPGGAMALLKNGEGVVQDGSGRFESHHVDEIRSSRRTAWKGREGKGRGMDMDGDGDRDRDEKGGQRIVMYGAD